MTDKRFNELLNGPLHHPMIPLQMTRLMLALRAVVEKTGEVGDKALEEHCADREEQDQENADYHQDAQEDLENAEDDDIPY